MPSPASNDPPIPVFLTEDEAAMALRVDKRTVRRLIVSQRLRAVDLGSGGKRHHYRIDASELKAVADPVESVVTPTPIGRAQRRRHSASAGSVSAYLPNAC